MLCLIILRYRRFRNGLRWMSKSGRWRMATGSFLLLAVGGGLFWGFYRSFIFLDSFLGMGQILVERLLYLFTFTVFLLLVFSNAIISFQLHFKARETAYLHSLPISPGTIYRFLLLESSLLSTGAAVFFLFPAALAYSLTHTVPWFALLLLFFLSAGLAALAAAAGALIAFLIPRLCRPGIGRKAAVAAAAALVLFFPFRRVLSPARRQRDETRLMINHLLDHSRITLSPVLPGYWAAEGFIQAGRGRPENSLGFLAVLGVNFLLLGRIASRAGEKYYFQTWADYRGRGSTGAGRRKRRPGPARSNFNRFFSGSLPGLLPLPVRALLSKDRKNFFRDPAQWLQAAILCGLLAVYIVNIRNMPPAVHQPFWKNLVTFFNLGAVSLILATLTTRFIYPAFSLEGKTFWILGLAPIRRKTIYRTRFWGGYGAAAAVSVPLLALSNRILEVSPEMAVLTTAAVILISGVLVSLATGLGAVFPNPGEDNPARIASGFGGTLNLVLSLIYIAAATGGLGLIGHFRTGIAGGGGNRMAEAGIGALVLFISLAGILTPYLLGRRALEQAEF